jgi:hypothetical protein
VALDGREPDLMLTNPFSSDFTKSSHSSIPQATIMPLMKTPGVAISMEALRAEFEAIERRHKSVAHCKVDSAEFSSTLRRLARTNPLILKEAIEAMANVRVVLRPHDSIAGYIYNAPPYLFHDDRNLGGLIGRLTDSRFENCRSHKGNRSISDSALSSGLDMST